MTATEQGIDATFKIAETTAGNDALVEAATGLRDGFSVGVKVNAHDFVDGVLVVAKGSLDEVSLVSEPAIDSARVSSVAASQDGEEYDEDEEEMKATDENSDPLDEETEETNPTTEGEQVSDTTVPESAAAETVEASKHVPMAYTAPRSPIVDKVSIYSIHSRRQFYTTRTLANMSRLPITQHQQLRAWFQHHRAEQLLTR